MDAHDKKDWQDTDRLDPVTEQELRELYAAPRDPRYWDRLETRIMWRVSAATAAAEDWAESLRGWSRVGLAAATIVAAMLGAVAWHQRTGEAQLAYESVLESSAPVSVQVRGR